MFLISRLSNTYLILILLLSIIVSMFALHTRKEFERQNIPVYDGVLYEYQQLNRYKKFANDYSFKNRYSQAIYEYEGNPVGGLYTSIITFLFPTFLQNDIDIFFRSLIGFFIFASAFYMFFRKRYSDKWTFTLLILITQLPILYHFRVGLGAYTPELIGAVYLLGGYLYLHLFLIDRKKFFFILGLCSFLFPLSFRYNFFAYASLISIPLLVYFIVKYNTFSKNSLKFISFSSIIVLSVFIFNLLYHFKAFYTYYTTVCYAIADLKSSVKYYSDNLLEFYSYKYLVILFLIIIGNSIFKRNHQQNQNCLLENFILLFPYFIYTIFIVFVMNSTNTPHITSISFFFGLLILPILNINFVSSYFTQFLYFNRKFYFALLVFCLLFFYFNRSSDTLDRKYEAQRFTVNYINYNNFKSMFLCYDAMLDIPVNTALYNEFKHMVPNTGYFVSNDVYLKFSCVNYSNCLNQYLNNVNTAELVVINEKEIDHYINPLAKKIRLVIRNKLINSKTHKLVLRKKFPHYGNILFYVKL